MELKMPRKLSAYWRQLWGKKKHTRSRTCWFMPKIPATQMVKIGRIMV
jgi:hypothetical protein